MNRGDYSGIYDWEKMGEILGNCDDGQMADFFVGFISEILKYPTRSASEMQIFYMLGSMLPKIKQKIFLNKQTEDELIYDFDNILKCIGTGIEKK